MSSREPRRCPACGAEMRFSHREYAGHGKQLAVFRCTACGATSRAPVPGEGDMRTGLRSRKPPVDEGPPDNPVIAPELARKLLGG
ncbi:MAG: hypothetical protein JOZ92_08420 [Candidatus Dormibacteraeota bacterium]|nr:hypothetical protein [Candidatus Dormibacteraeota bacterium]